MGNHAKALTAIILAAGNGTRMKSANHKVLHSVGGLAMVSHLLNTLDQLDLPIERALVVGALKDQLEAALAGEKMITQPNQLGTGDAVKICEGHITAGADLLVLFGDTPLITLETLKAMIAAKAEGAGVVVLGFNTDHPTGYGRLIEENGTLQRIVEEKDASPAEKAVTLCNSGVMLIDGEKAFEWVNKITNDNAAGEYYLTDVIKLARHDGFDTLVVRGSLDEVQGVNSRADLARVEGLFQRRKRADLMANGVTLIDPDSCFFAYDTVIESDCILEPHVVIGPGVRIANGVTVKAFTHLEGCTIGANASVGPYARIRPGSAIGADVKIGNFVETKKADIEAGAKISHLSYIGDARVGTDANIGAGTITCNYDGYNKSHTDVGAGAFIGSNSALVAPVSIGDGAIVGAGSVITQDVAYDALGLTRAKQKNMAGAATRLRKKQQAIKAKKTS